MVAALGDQRAGAASSFSPPILPTTARAVPTLAPAVRFFGWCEHRGLTLTAIRPFDVAAWVKELEEHQAPGVKQQLAAVRMLFDWLIIGQVMPIDGGAEAWTFGGCGGKFLALSPTLRRSLVCRG